MKPYLSVVIPAHNEEETIRQCLDAIVPQIKDKSVEVIVVSNASTDRTSQIVEDCISHASIPIYLISEQRKGYIFAIKTGYDSARGEIIATTDADTVVGPRWVQTIVDFFTTHDDVVGVGGRIAVSGNRPKELIISNFVFPALQWMTRKKNIYFWGANFAVRKNAFLRAGGWDTKINLQSDIDLARRLARIGGVEFLRELLVFTSPRRFTPKSLFRSFPYLINYLSLVYRGKPFAWNFYDVREVKRSSPHSL